LLKNNFWKNKKILITGHTGFKGSWLTIWLRMLEANITGYALEPKYSKDNFVLSGLSEKVNHIVGDIRDYDNLEKVFREFQPEIVFHLAAQPLVLKSYKEPKETFDVNIGGTVNILESSRKTKSVKTIVNVTSDKCYLDVMPKKGYIETNRLGGYDCYSSSKAASELVTEAYRNSFFNPDNLASHNVCLSSVRAGNVIGGGDWNENRLIPDCIRSLEKNENIYIRNPKYYRPWQHVLEPLNGYLILAEKMYNNPEEYSGSWNFGPNSDSIINVEAVVDKLIQFWGSGDWELYDNNQEKVYEDKKLFLNPAKSHKLLDWNSKYNIDESIKVTLDWYKSYPHSQILDFCEYQIKNYISLG